LIKINQNFGRLTVLKESSFKHNAHKGKYYECLCNCGQECIIKGEYLTTGTTKSCGCLRREIAYQKALSQKNKPKIKNRKRPYEWLYNIMFKSAIKRFQNCDISYEDFLKFTEIKLCHYCNSKIIWPSEFASVSGRPENYNLDRKDNSLGYLRNNVVVCCFKCNESKSNIYTYEEWVVMTTALKKFRSENRL